MLILGQDKPFSNLVERREMWWLFKVRFLKYNNENCPICYDPIGSKDRTKLHCGHLFHRSCIDRWTAVCEHEATCPMCRTIYSENKDWDMFYESLG